MKHLHPSTFILCLCLIAAWPFVQGGCGGSGGSSSPPPPPPLCDLWVSSVDATDGTYYPGDSFFVSNSVTNDGPDDCPGYTATFYLTRPNSYTQIASYSRGALPSGFTDAFDSLVTLPFGLPDADYYIDLHVTCANDPDTSNNGGFDPVPITMLAGLPDLYDDGDEWNGWSLAGESFNVWCSVRNGGNAHAIAFDGGNICVDFFASTDTTITASDYRIERLYVPWVGAGCYTDLTVSIPLYLMPSIPDGTYYIGWIIDFWDKVIESNESNNTACVLDKFLIVSLPAGPAAFVPLNTDAGDSPATRTLTIKYRQARR